MSSELLALWESAGGKCSSDAQIVSFDSLLQDAKSLAVGVMYPGENTKGGIPLIKVGDISGGKVVSRPSYLISADVNKEYVRTQLKGDELLITLVGNPGECVIVNSEMRGWNAARAIAVARLKEPSLRTYIKAVLESRAGKHLIDAVLNTTVQKTLNLKDLKRLPIPLPPKIVVESVSDFLTYLDDRITLLRTSNATLEAMAQALFKSWFVDFDPVHAKQQGRAPEGMDAATAALFPDSFEESELGMVPKGWIPVRLDSFVELAYGKALKAEARIAGDVPVYGSGGITGWHNTALVNEPSIVVGRKGTVGSLYWENRPFFPIDTVFYVKTKKPLSYVFQVLKTLRLSDMNTDAAVPGLNRENAYRLLVAGAPERVIGAFDAIASSLRCSVIHNMRKMETLEALRDTLLPRLISGQLRLPEAQELAQAAVAD